MPARLRLLRDDDGISLVEILVGLTILAVVLSALASGIITSLTTIQKDERRVRATQLANATLEDLRGSDWADLGFYGNDTGYFPTYTGSGCDSTCETVTLGAVRPAGSDAPLPATQTITPPGGTGYDQTIDVFWIDDPAVAGPRDYKHFRVALEWETGGTSRSYEAVGTRIPTVAEVPVSAAPGAGPGPSPSASPAASPSPTPSCSGQISDFGVFPTNATLSPSGNLRDDLDLSVTTCSSVTTVSVATGRSIPTTLTDVSGSGTQWEATISAGAGGFSEGTRTFTATATPGGSTATENVTFVRESAGPAPTISAPQLTPGAPICVDKSNNDESWFAVTINVAVAEMGTGGQAQVTWTDRDGAPTGSATTAFSSSSGTATATIPSDTRLAGPVDIAVTATRSSDGASSSATYPVQVTDKNKADQC